MGFFNGINNLIGIVGTIGGITAICVIGFYMYKLAWAEQKKYIWIAIVTPFIAALIILMLVKMNSSNNMIWFVMVIGSLVHVWVGTKIYPYTLDIFPKDEKLIRFAIQAIWINSVLWKAAENKLNEFKAVKPADPVKQD